MAPPKKQKREYNAGDAVWVKVKGWPTWPGIVEDVKNVTNESVLKKKRKNAVLVKFLETGSDSYSWASHDEINPFQKETFDDFLINTNHKNFNAWKKAFTLVAKEAGIGESDIEATLTKAKSVKSSPSPRKRKERENEETTTPKRRKSSSASPSPKRTARHASTGDKKKTTTPKKAAAAPKKNLLKPTLDSSESLLNELNTLLVKYNTDKEDEKIYQLLKIISNFAIADHAILSTVQIGDTIKKLSTDGDHTQNIQKIAIKITEYYDSLKKVEEKEEEKEEEKKEENGEVKTEGSEEKKEGEDIVISENTEAKTEDKMETEKPAESSDVKPEETTTTTTA